MSHDSLTLKQRETASKRLKLLRAVEKYLAEGKRLKEALPLVGIGRASYHRYRKAYEEYGVQGLADRCHERRSGQRKMSDEETAFMADCLLRQERPHVRTVYNIDYIDFCNTIGLNPVSYNTFLRAFNEIPEAVRIKNRLGRKAYNDSHPYIIRDLNAQKPLACIMSDHYQMDIAMIGSRGTPVFPWVTWWMDLGSRFPLGWCLSERPNQDTINMALYQTILRYGIPAMVYIDNGRDYKSKMFTGMTTAGTRYNEFRMEVDELAIKGIYHTLRIETTYSQPYNAKAKPIEPAHRTLHNLERRYYGYRGTSVADRTGYMAGGVKGGEGLDPSRLPKRDEMEARLSEILGQYSILDHKGLNGESPREVFHSKWTKPPADYIPDEGALRLLMMKVANKFYKVSANGIRFKGEWYYADFLMVFEGGKVALRYDPKDKDKRGLINCVNVYDGKDVFLGTAHLKAKAPAIGASTKIFENLGHQKGVRSSIVADYKRETNLILQRLADGDMQGIPDA